MTFKSKIKTYMATVKTTDQDEASKFLEGLRVVYGIGGVFAPHKSGKAALYGCHVEDEEKFYEAIYNIDQLKPEESFFKSPQEVKHAWENDGVPGIMTLKLCNLYDHKSLDGPTHK